MQLATTNATTLSTEDILTDFRTALESRHASLIGRKEVFMGKAKFGIFGDGKEVPQLAMARAFAKGDIRSGYYRDQTFMLAIGELSLEAYFAQLYAHADVTAEPSSAGRSMNSHFSTRMLDENGQWKNLTEQRHSSADISPTAGQMPRLLGLAYASKLYRQNPELHQYTNFSNKGNEVAWGTIGNASSAEGLFWESINAAGVLQVPMLTSIWDDGYGISVPNSYQIAKDNIGELLQGFQRTEHKPGFEIFSVKGWNYEQLVDTYNKAAEICRNEHVPVIVHVTELTQPQGHSTSGSHERYKTKDRLQWEKEHDCIDMMRSWLLDIELATEAELDEMEKVAIAKVKEARKNAWNAFTASIQGKHKEAVELLTSFSNTEVQSIGQQLQQELNPTLRVAVSAVRKALRYLREDTSDQKQELQQWLKEQLEENEDRFNSHLHSGTALEVPAVAAEFSDDSKTIDGREIMQACFTAAFEREPLLFAIGEDVGRIGDVNQGFAGLQDEFGEIRVTDTGIREATILGQGIGAAMRGLRPIIEIQYLDYIFYALQGMTDDLATLHYRTKGGQKAPLIVRTRGHRLEGIWHSGSPIGAIINAIRGMYLLVPRNMTQAAGFYNTLLQADEPGLIIECLNGYRLKEQLPDNIGEFTVPLGQVETIREGSDITIVTYGSMCRIVMQAAEELSQFGIELEVIDVQSLLPFDLQHEIVESVKKTNRVIFADEDVPGGASAFMMQQVLDEQQAYRWLDAQPVCISAKAHRPAYADDGDYFSKPSADDIFDAAYALMHEAEPEKYPKI